MSRGKRAGRPLVCGRCGEPATRKVGGKRLFACDDCLRLSVDEWHEHASVPGWETRLRSTYGLDPDDHGWRFVQQHGLCAICRDAERSDREHGVGLVVDHNHDTGEVRGLLCSRCNMAIGLLRDNPYWALDAAAYLLMSDGCTPSQWDRFRGRFLKLEHLRKRIT